MVLVAVMVFGVVASSGLTADPSGLPYSEFEVTGADGQLDHLPSIRRPGQQAVVDVTVSNHLGRAADYTLMISLSDSMAAAPSTHPSLYPCPRGRGGAPRSPLRTRPVIGRD